MLKILKEKVQCCNVSADCPTSKRIQGAYVKDKVSAKKSTDTFYIGNKSYDIVDKLCNINIVSEQLHSHFKAELVAASEQFAMPVGKRVMHDRPQAHLYRRRTPANDTVVDTAVAWLPAACTVIGSVDDCTAFQCGNITFPEVKTVLHRPKIFWK